MYTYIIKNYFYGPPQLALSTYHTVCVETIELCRRQKSTNFDKDKFQFIAPFTTHLVILSGAQRSRRIYALTTCIADIRYEDPSTRLRLGRDDSILGDLKQTDKLQFTK